MQFNEILVTQNGKYTYRYLSGKKFIKGEAKQKKAKRKEAKIYLTQRKGSDTVSVSLHFASKRKKIRSENGTS